MIKGAVLGIALTAVLFAVPATHIHIHVGPFHGIGNNAKHRFAALGTHGFPLDPTSLWGVYDPLIDLGPAAYWCARDAICFW